MKWLIIVLVLASLLIVLGVTLTGDRPGAPAPHHPEAVALCEEGTADLHAFRLRDAVDKLGRSLQIEPGLAEASIARAVAFVRLGQRDDFKTELARADSLADLIPKEQQRLLAQLRLSDFRSSRFYAMRDSVRARLEVLAPDDIYVLVADATDAARAGDDELREQTWRRILEVDPNFANAYNMLGYLELGRGNYEQAIEHMQKYAFLAPDLANPHDSLGEVYMAMGRYEEAEAEFRTSVKMQPDFYHSLINLGRVYLSRGQHDTGMNILEKVREQVQGSDIEMQIDRQIISTYLITGLESDLARASAEYIAQYPKDPIGGMYRAIRLAYMDRHDESRAVMDSLLTSWRGESGDMSGGDKRGVESAAQQYEGLLADLQGRPADAAAAWTAALEAHGDTQAPHDTWFFRYRAADALLASGRTEEALATVDKVLSINPRLIPVLLVKVRAHLALNDGAGARAALEQLQWSLRMADEDHPSRAEAAELETRVSALAVGR